MKSLPRRKYDEPQHMRLSRDAINLLDAMSDELGLRSRKASVELLVRWARRIKDKARTSWSDLLLTDKEPAKGSKDSAA